MKTLRQISRAGSAAFAVLLCAGCAATGSVRTADNRRPSPRTVTDTWATETPAADVRLRQDAYGNRVASNDRVVTTGSFIPQDVNIVGNSADTALPVRVYGQGDLRRRGGGGFSTADSLSRIDPAITVGGR